MTTTPTPLCLACLASAHTGGEPDFPHRAARDGEACGAADHPDLSESEKADLAERLMDEARAKGPTLVDLLTPASRALVIDAACAGHPRDVEADLESLRFPGARARLSAYLSGSFSLPVASLNDYVDEVQAFADARDGTRDCHWCDRYPGVECAVCGREPDGTDDEDAGPPPMISYGGPVDGRQRARLLRLRDEAAASASAPVPVPVPVPAQKSRKEVWLVEDTAKGRSLWTRVGSVVEHPDGSLILKLSPRLLASNGDLHVRNPR